MTESRSAFAFAVSLFVDQSLMLLRCSSELPMCACVYVCLPAWPRNLNAARSADSFNIRWQKTQQGRYQELMLQARFGHVERQRFPCLRGLDEPHIVQKKEMDTLGIEPRAFRMRSGCDTATPCARCERVGNILLQISHPAYLKTSFVPKLV